MTEKSIDVLRAIVSERSTVSCMNAPAPPPIQKGKQNYRFKVGDTAISSGAGPIKAGVEIKIIERYKQHGYAYYVDDKNRVHRDKDLS